jgi:hypothetical protein
LPVAGSLEAEGLTSQSLRFIAGALYHKL